jgi:hypothetical protein
MNLSKKKEDERPGHIPHGIHVSCGARICFPHTDQDASANVADIAYLYLRVEIYNGEVTSIFSIFITLCG